MVLETMPLTPNGKIDRRALPKPDPTTHSTSAVGPRDDYELTLLGIWQRVLGANHIGVTDNFFEIGGHSLLAVRLLTEIKAATGRDIPLAALFQGATIEYMARLLHSNSQMLPHLTVTQIQKGGNLPPFFVAVVPGANSLGYLSLARYIGPEQPLYKLQGPGPRLRHRPYTAAEFEKLAFDSIQAIRSVQPQGPYYIGGMCGGARIAFDIARLLEAEGQEVRLLSIFDTWVVENSQRRFLWYFHYYYQRLQKFGALPRSQKREMFLSAFRKKLRRLSGRVENEKSLWRQSYWPAKEFQLPKYHGRITLFKIPKQPFYYVRDPFMGWGNRTTGTVDIEFIRSEHLKLLRQPYVQELGQKLSECLQRAQRGNTHAGSIVQVSLPSSYASAPLNGAAATEDNFASVADDQADE
jgi:thioesterase domain-containing protein